MVNEAAHSTLTAHHTRITESLIGAACPCSLPSLHAHPFQHVRYR